MGLFGNYKTDGQLEREGRWFTLPVNNPDGTQPSFKMARMHANNPAYQAAIERVSDTVQIALEMGTLTEKTAGPVMRQVFVDTVLLDWKDVIDDTGDFLGEPGAAIPYSKDNAVKLLEQLPDVFQILMVEAKKLGNFRGNEVKSVAEK